MPGGTLQERLVRYLEHYDRSRLKDLDSILYAYRDREADLWEALQSKYGPEPFVSSVTPLPPGPGGVDRVSHYRERLLRIYLEYCPEATINVDGALFTFRGREDEMIALAVAKYGPEPDWEARYQRLVKYYQYFAPNKVPFVRDILYAYSGEFPYLMQLLSFKYGPFDPSVAVAGSDGSKGELQRVEDLTKVRLKEYFARVAPEKLLVVDDIVLAYSGRHSELFQRLALRYGPESLLMQRGTPFWGSPGGAATNIGAASGGTTVPKSSELREGGGIASLFPVSPVPTPNRLGMLPTTSLPSKSLEQFLLVIPLSDRLKHYYQKYCPEKIADIPDIVDRYAGTEHDLLFLVLENKYGPESAAYAVDRYTGGSTEGYQAWQRWIEAPSSPAGRSSRSRRKEPREDSQPRRGSSPERKVRSKDGAAPPPLGAATPHTAKKFTMAVGHGGSTAEGMQMSLVGTDGTISGPGKSSGRETQPGVDHDDGGGDDDDGGNGSPATTSASTSLRQSTTASSLHHQLDRMASEDGGGTESGLSILNSEEENDDDEISFDNEEDDDDLDDGGHRDPRADHLQLPPRVRPPLKRPPQKLPMPNTPTNRFTMKNTIVPADAIFRDSYKFDYKGHLYCLGIPHVNAQLLEELGGNHRKAMIMTLVAYYLRTTTIEKPTIQDIQLPKFPTEEDEEAFQTLLAMQRCVQREEAARRLLLREFSRSWQKEVVLREFQGRMGTLAVEGLRSTLEMEVLVRDLLMDEEELKRDAIVYERDRIGVSVIGSEVGRDPWRRSGLMEETARKRVETQWDSFVTQHVAQYVASPAASPHLFNTNKRSALYHYRRRDGGATLSPMPKPRGKSTPRKKMDPFADRPKLFDDSDGDDGDRHQPNSNRHTFHEEEDTPEDEMSDDSSMQQEGENVDPFSRVMAPVPAGKPKTKTLTADSFVPRKYPTPKTAIQHSQPFHVVSLHSTHEIGLRHKTTTTPAVAPVVDPVPQAQAKKPRPATIIATARKDAKITPLTPRGGSSTAPSKPPSLPLKHAPPSASAASKNVVDAWKHVCQAAKQQRIGVPSASTPRA